MARLGRGGQGSNPCMETKVLWAVSANGNTSGLQPEIESSILSRSTKLVM